MLRNRKIKDQKSKIKILFPKRRSDTNKGDYGRALIIGGSAGMTGAAVLAARACLRTGAGLTYLAVPKELVNIVDSMTPEVITLSFENISSLNPGSIAIGPGLGRDINLIDKLLRTLINRKLSLVIDADAINAIAERPEMIKNASANMILTPHPGEMSRLMKKPVDQIQKDRVNVAKEAARLFNSIVILKGYKTVIARPSGETAVNATGNPGMAKGGTGDVLTGMIAGLAAQGLSSWDAAIAGVYLHGLAGDLAAKEKGEYGMIASDIIEQIPYAIQKIR